MISEIAIADPKKHYESPADHEWDPPVIIVH